MRKPGLFFFRQPWARAALSKNTLIRIHTPTDWIATLACHVVRGYCMLYSWWVRINTHNCAHSVFGWAFLPCYTTRNRASLQRQVMNASLSCKCKNWFKRIDLYARVCASTFIGQCILVLTGWPSDPYAGPFTWRANEAAMRTDRNAVAIRNDEAETAFTAKKLANKEKIHGFGHAPLQWIETLRKHNQKVSKTTQRNVGDDHLYAVSKRCEAVMWRRE